MLNANRDKFVASDQQLQDIRFAQRELERLKIQFRDERNAWQKQNYIDARIEQKLDLLEKQLSDLGKVNFSKHNDVSISSDNDMLVILSDLHIGQTFHSFFGEYNTDIAKDRMQQLLDNIIKRADELKLYDLDDFEIDELRESFAILDLIVAE